MFTYDSRKRLASRPESTRYLHRPMLLCLALLLGTAWQPGMLQGQILTFEFSALDGDEATAGSNFNDANLNASTISRGAGLNASANGGRFNATSWAVTSIDNAVSGDEYMEFTIAPQSGYQFSVSSIVVQWTRSATANTAISLRSSVDSYATDLDAVKTVVDNTSMQTFTWTFTQANSSSPVTYRFYSYAEETGGSGGPGDGAGNDIVVYGTVTTASPTISKSGTAAALATTAGTASASTSVGVTGTNLTADITATAPGGFEVSNNDSSWAGPATFSQSGGNASGTLYVRLAASAAVGYYSGNVTLESTDATPVNVAVEGTVDLPAPTANPASATNVTDFTASWTQVTDADGYRLDVSTNGSFVGSGATVVGWNFNDDNLTADTGFVINASQEVSNVGAGSIGYINRSTGNRAVSVSTWDSGSGTKYWQVAFDASGVGQLTVSSVQRATSTGPRDFKLQYRVGAGGVWADVAGGSLQTADDYTTGVLSNVPLPDAAAGQAEVFLRWIMTSNTSVGGGTVAAGGTSAIDDIVITGKLFSFLPGYENRMVTDGSTASASVTGLVSSTAYFYRVRATNDTSTSGNSVTQSVTTLVMPAPAVQAGSNIGGVRFDANWSAVPEATGYFLDVSTNNVFSNFQAGYQSNDVGNVTTHTVTGLVVEVTYYYRVRAYDAGSTSASSATQTVATVLKATPSNHATGFTNAVTTHRTIVLDWTDAAGPDLPDGYIVRGSTNSYADIPVPVDSNTVGNVYTWKSRYAHRVEYGEERDEVTGEDDYGLIPGHTYYFKLFPVANSGDYSRYKTDGVVPQLTVTTLTDVPFEDFERGVTYGGKTTYATGNVTLKSGDWELNDALLNSDDEDKKHDQRALRIRNIGVATMLSPVTDVETVLLDHANYTGDTGGIFIVERSIDNGSTWQQIGAEVTCGDTLQTASFTVHRLAAFRLRIRKTAAASDTNRINIDNIRFTPFRPPPSVFRFN